MNPRISASDRARVIAFVGRVPTAGRVLELRANGVKLAGADLDALLAKAVARERVECEVDLLAYEQGAQDSKGNRIPNRRGLRIRDGALAALARSAVGVPFQRDHDLGTLAKGGEVLASKLERGDNGLSRIVQTVRLMEPAAVERAARGLLSAVSIHAEPTPGATVTCTACGTAVFSKCYHAPLDVVSGADGVETTVEWEFSDAFMLEVSECAIPAVPNAGPMSPIRAAFAFLQHGTTTPPYPDEAPPMKRTFSLLKLSEQASDDAAAEAVEILLADATTARAELAVVAARETAQAVELAAFRLAKTTTERAAFLDGLVNTGRIALADVGVWGDLYDASEAKARTRGTALAANSATPVGAAVISIAPGEPAVVAPKIPAPEFKHGVLLAHNGETVEQYQARKAALTAKGN